MMQVADKIRNRKAPSEYRKTKSNSYNPIVVFSSRTVKNVDAYKTAFTKYAEDAQSKGAGVRALFSFMDREEENTALQLAWYDVRRLRPRSRVMRAALARDAWLMRPIPIPLAAATHSTHMEAPRTPQSPADYVAPPASLTSCYSGTEATDYTAVWGGWDDAMKEKMASPGGCKCSFVREVRGFLKDPTATNAKGFATGEPPMIWISRRNILPGRMEACGSSFRALGANHRTCGLRGPCLLWCYYYCCCCCCCC